MEPLMTEEWKLSTKPWRQSTSGDDESEEERTGFQSVLPVMEGASLARLRLAVREFLKGIPGLSLPKGPGAGEPFELASGISL